MSMLIHPGLGLGPHPRLSFFSGRFRNGAIFFKAARCWRAMRHSCRAFWIASNSPLEMCALTNSFTGFKPFSASFADAEVAEDGVEDVFAGDFASNRAERGGGGHYVDGDYFRRHQ